MTGVKQRELVDWKAFARRLFAMEDADPMYYALERANLNTEHKQRFMVGWVTYYHPGVAAKASEYANREFWQYLLRRYTDAPRASERRHFRGNQGLKALDAWQKMFPTPERMITHMQGDTYFEVRKQAKDVPQIGDYFIWKFADVQDRVFHIPCDFANAAKFSPKVPQEGAKLISETATVEQVYNLIIRHMSDMKAPPAYDRPINMQEAETVCCVYHQYLGEGYTWMSRTAKAARRLMSVPCYTTDHLLEALMNHEDRGFPASNKARIQQWCDNVLGEK